MEVLTDSHKQKLKLDQTKRNQINHRSRAKPFDKRGISFFCVNRCGWQYETADHKCPVCNVLVIRGPTYDSVAKRMKKILELNREFLEAKLWFEDEKYTFKIPLKIGSEFYFVPLRYWIEFDGITNTDHSQYERFFEFIKKSCVSDKL